MEAEEVQDGTRGREEERFMGVGILGTSTGSTVDFWGTKASTSIQAQQFGHRADESLNSPLTH